MQLNRCSGHYFDIVSNFESMSDVTWFLRRTLLKFVWSATSYISMSTIRNNRWRLLKDKQVRWLYRPEILRIRKSRRKHVTRKPLLYHIFQNDKVTFWDQFSRPFLWRDQFCLEWSFKNHRSFWFAVEKIQPEDVFWSWHSQWKTWSKTDLFSCAGTILFEVTLAFWKNVYNITKHFLLSPSPPPLSINVDTSLL